MDTIFFILSKTIGMLVRVEIWLLIALLIALVVLWRGQIGLAKTVLSCVFLFLLVLSYHPLGAKYLAQIEASYPVEPPLDQVDGIIILGGVERRAAMVKWGPVQLGAGAERYTVALELANRFEQAKVLFTGGSGHLTDLQGIEASEAEVARHFFSEHGIAAERILLEGRSRNTAENAAFSRAVANPTPDEVWVLITSAYHMPRSVRSFQSAGWTNIVPYPVDFRTAGGSGGFRPYLNLADNMDQLNLLTKELLGSLVYRVTGR